MAEKSWLGAILDDIRHNLVERPWFGREVTGEAQVTPEHTQGDKVGLNYTHMTPSRWPAGSYEEYLGLEPDANTSNERGQEREQGQDIDMER